MDIKSEEYDTKKKELNKKRELLRDKQSELKRKQDKLYGQVSLPMSLLQTDSDGLSTSGALLGFAHTSDTPQLFDSAMGKLALYFQGTNEHFFTAYYDTKTARAQRVIDIGGKKVNFLARSVGAESNSATINISAGESDDTCQVTIANSQIGITETWNKVPRSPRMFSKVINGQAKPLYLGQVGKTSGTVTELTLVEATNRQLAAGAVLKIGDTQVTTTAAVPVNATSIPINSASVDIEADTPVYLVVYDYAANASVTSSALEFDGTNDYVELGDFNPGNTFTIELWVKPNNTNNNMCFIGKNTASGENIFLLGYWKNKLDALLHSKKLAITGQNTSGNWFHLAVVVNQVETSSTIKLYKDGSSIGEETVTETLGNLEGKPWTLGQEWDSSRKSDFFSGQIDEVRMWNYARTEEQIQADKERRLSGNETGLVGYWHFEGGLAKDYSGNRDDGTIYGNPKNVPSPLTLINNSYLQLENGSRQFLVYSEATEGTIADGTVTSLGDVASCRWVADAPGLALDFDGQNQYLALAEANLEQMDATANLTLEAWVKPQRVSNVTRVIHHKSANSQYTLGLQKMMSALEFDGIHDYVELGDFNPGNTFTIELWVRPNNTSNGQCFIGKNSASGGNIFLLGYWNNGLHALLRSEILEITGENTSENWFHLAVVVNQIGTSSTINLYKDGSSLGEETVTQKLGNPEGKPWTLGQDWDDSETSDFFSGQIDEVRMWNYARSEEQIQADKERRLSGNETGLVGYWHFEGGIAKDYSGNGHDGTIYRYGDGDPSNVASALNDYKVVAGVSDHFLRSKDIIPSGNWNHLTLSYHQSYALNFDGNDYLDCGKNRMLNLCEDLTIETVIQVSDSNRRSILTKGQMGYGIAKASVPYALRVQGGKLIFSFEDSQGRIHTLESPASKIHTNKVHKIAVTRKKVIETTDSGADATAWGIGDVANIGAKTGDFSDAEKKKIDKAMKADYVASKKRGKGLKDGLRNQNSSGTSSSSTFISGQGTAEWLELKMYIDEVLVCSEVIEPAVDAEGNSQPLEIGRTGNNYFKGKIAEVKLWSRALEKGEIHQNLTGQEEGLVAWWQLEENEGNLANDFKGGNHAQIKGASWCKNPDVEASELLLYGNGIPLRTESVPSTDSLVTWGDNQFTLGGYKNGSYQEYFNGTLEEVRVWKVVRTQEQILDNIFTRLKGEKQDLLANYTFDEIADNQVKDSSLAGNHLPLGADDNKPTSVFSNAPISNDTPQVRSALAEVQTVFNEEIASSPAISEYADLQYDSQQNLTGAFKRCYTYIKDGKWQLITGYKVGNLITEWISQVQFDPQIIGYIEGAPPIPSENMTVGPITASDTDTYKQASTVELIESEEVTYNFSSSKENGFDSSFEASMSAGVDLDLRTLLAPLGFGVSFNAEIQFNVSGSGRFDSSGSWTEEKSTTSGRTLTRNMRASMSGYWEDESNLLNQRLGRRYVPQNQGFALVQSETADVFALRLAHNKALISYRFQPNPDIPKDWNIISFPINPRYTKQGTLDGKVGYQPNGSVQTDPDYPQATQYGQYSYFKPIETYALKRQIDREVEELKNYYQNYDASPLSNGILKDVMSTNTGLLASAAAAIPGAGIGLGAATTFGSLADALTKDQSLPEKFATRNLANTYVWTADGGFYSETTNTMDVRQESSSGSYSFNSNFSGGISLNVAAGGSFGFDLNGSMGGHLNMTQSKSAEASRSFQVEVQVNPQSDLYQYEIPLEQQDWDTPNVDFLLQYDTQGNPIKVPGKVDAYRFMTFYLEPKAENFEDFYSKVVDPIWIEQSDEPNAKALREAKQSEKKPACWRIMHRVTFVSRVLQDFNDDAASQLAKDARALNIESNWQLVKTLEPFVKNKTDSFVQLADAVRDALAEYLPELQPHSQEIIQYMTQYYGLPEDV
ncbi:MAG: LamG domain-containing protein [Symploca sp. SIO2D2]|nr:LamG domain-containing protein [Symploca sp. SIO2D2]